MKPKENKHHARYVFINMRPAHDETTIAYSTRLKVKANNCEFSRSQLRWTKLGTPNPNNTESIAHLKSYKQEMVLTRLFNRSCSNLTWKFFKMRRSLDDSLRSCVHPRLNKAVGDSDPVDIADKQTNRRKAKTVQHMEKNACNVRSSITLVLCPSLKARTSKKGNRQRRDFEPQENWRHKSRIKRTTQEEDGDTSTSSDNEFFCQAVRHPSSKTQGLLVYLKGRRAPGNLLLPNQF